MSLTDEEILEMAQDAFICRIVPFPVRTDRIITFARLIAAKQREIDAALLLSTDLSGISFDPKLQGFIANMLNTYSTAIRSQKP
jgi:hypothetical protein